MAELCAETGVPRETIHFYLREGLVPRPRKGGRTIAYYDETHVERLRTIRRLREEKYLPLAVIRRLLDAPAAARDVDVLAEVLQLDKGLTRAPAALRPASKEASAEATRRGLLSSAKVDPADSRLLALVDEALSFGDAAKALTLDDFELCAEELTRLVDREAGLFFDHVFATGDVASAVAALREGRGAVARFITAYRDRRLQRLVEELLTAIDDAQGIAARARVLPLSEAKERALGVAKERARLEEALERTGGADEAKALVWFHFARGESADLAKRAPSLAGALAPREAAITAWAVYDAQPSAEAMAAHKRTAHTSGMALAQVLVGEAELAWAVRRKDQGASLVEDAAKAIHRLVRADVEGDEEPLARALGAFHQGRVELSLPRVLGRGAGAAARLERALVIVAEQGEAIEASARALIEGNTHLMLGRALVAEGETERGERHLSAAATVDPRGPIAKAARVS